MRATKINFKGLENELRGYDYFSNTIAKDEFLTRLEDAYAKDLSDWFSALTKPLELKFLPCEEYHEYNNKIRLFLFHERMDSFEMEFSLEEVLKEYVGDEE